MGEYANVKSKQFVRFLKWLQKHKRVQLTKAGKHNLKITCIHNGKSYPIPSSHDEINKRIVKAFMLFLVSNDICTKDEFDENL